VGPDGTVYFTDSGLKAGPQGFAPTGTDAVYRFDAAGRPVAVARDTSLGHPNGLLADSAGLVVVTFGSGAVFLLDAAGQRTDLAKPPAGALDGVVRLADGSLLVSSWEGKAVYHLASGAAAWTTAVDSVESPADIGYDTKRQRVLIPLFTPSEVRTVAVR
jgi:sugar lactone lactonase YvrE